MAMTGMRGAMRLAGLAAAVALSACSSDDNSRSGVMEIAPRLARQLTQGTPSPSRIATPPEVLRGYPDPLIRLVSERTGDEALAVLQVRNGPNTTWMTGNQRSLVLRDGQIAATRGFGGDLMSADLPPLDAQGPTIREHYYIGGDEETKRLWFTCMTSPAGEDRVEVIDRLVPTRRLREHCTGDGRSFENFYWYDTEGDLVQARQWIGPDLGYLTVTALFD